MHTSAAFSEAKRARSKWERAAREGHAAAASLLECAASLEAGTPDALPPSAAAIQGAATAFRNKLASRQQEYAERLLECTHALVQAADDMYNAAAERMQNSANARSSLAMHMLHTAASECKRCADERRYVAQQMAERNVSVARLKALFAAWSAAPHMTPGLLDDAENVLEAERRR